MSGPYQPDRRQLLAAACGAAAATATAQPAPAKKYPFKKSINQWAFPYPERMNLEACLRLAKAAGFDAVELNYDLDNDLSPKNGPAEFAQVRRLAEKIGVGISGVCSFLFWPYPLTSNDPAKRARGLELAGKIAECAHHLGTENVLVVPGAVHIPWRTDHEPVPNDVCDRRAKEAVRALLPAAEKLRVFLNIENIFFKIYRVEGAPVAPAVVRKTLIGVNDFRLFGAGQNEARPEAGIIAVLNVKPARGSFLRSRRERVQEKR